MIATESEHRLFQLNPQFSDPLRRILFPMVKAPLEKVLLLDRINRMYRAMEKPSDSGDFLKKVIHILNIRIRCEENDLERIPRQGPVIVVMNHPYGGLEGILAASLLQSRREDIKIMANYLLSSLSELAGLFILADPFGGEKTLSRNVAAMREAIRWLKMGGLLGIFPAGEVSHFCFNQRKVIDPPWNKGLVRILAKTQSPVLPVYFNGYNGPLFQIAGLVHSRLRTALLPRELLNKQKKEIEIRIGNWIPYKSLALFPSDEDKLNYLRHRTYMLAHRGPRSKIINSAAAYQKKAFLVPVVSTAPSGLLAEEIQALPVNQTLLVREGLRVAFAFSPQIPRVLREIGRLRELTFRQAGEGTGKNLDLDQYDSFYLHLFLWNAATQEIIGAYRIGPTDRLLNRPGRKGLYTQTLFSFHPAFFNHIHPALELGRSFVRVEYQKSFNALAFGNIRSVPGKEM